MLDRIPEDVFSLILGNINAAVDLKNLSATSRLLYRQTTPHLYRSITIRAPDEQDLADLDLRSLRESARHLRWVREVHVEANFHQKLRRRCPQDEGDEEDDWRNTDPDESDEEDHSPRPLGIHDTFLAILESRLLPLLNSIPDGSLLGFSWKLGTCMPRAIVDYLSERQCQIRSLTIVTDITCRMSWNLGVPTLCHLRGLPRLRKISWTIRNLEEIEAFGSILQSSAAHLEDIQLDYGYPRNMNNMTSNPCVERLLKLSAGQQLEPLVALRRLTMRGVPFTFAVDKTTSSFGVPHLQLLTVHNCHHTNEMLSTLTDRPVQLTALEIGFTGAYSEQFDQAPLATFLRSFRGLRDLFVLNPRWSGKVGQFSHAVFHHKSTLRRLVHHQAGYSNEGATNAVLVRGLWEFEKLQCFGLDWDAHELSDHLKSIQPRPPLKVLHIRVAGLADLAGPLRDHTERTDELFLSKLPDVERFADWVFGPEGLPALEVLAFGDFTFHGRQPNILFGRQSQTVMDEQDVTTSPGQNFRALDSKEARLCDLIQDNLDFLEACPEDCLLHGLHG